MKLYGIFGAGGFGREVMPVAADMLKQLLTATEFKLVFIDQNTSVRTVNGYSVLSVEEFFAENALEKYFNITIANHELRKQIAETMTARGARPFSIIASNNISLANNEIGEGAIFCPYTTVTANAKIGKYFHANIYSYVAHDCIIGDYVTFAPDVHCNGNVIIEDYVYIGTGVIIKQGLPDKPLVIGKGAIVGMGAVVTKSIAAYQTVVGNPARPLVRVPAENIPVQQAKAE